MNKITDTDFFAGDVYIQEGACPVPGTLVVACTIGDDGDSPKNRVRVRRDGGWLDFGVSKEAILSIDAHESGDAYVLGENGSVVRFDWRAPTTQAELKASRRAWRNPAVEDLGPLRRIRLLGPDVVCAGSVGQAYHMVEGQFDRLPPLSFKGEALTIEDLAGDSLSDFVAVTSDGYAAHFDGTQWQILDLPTNASLTSICSVGSDYVIAGKNATLLRGNHKQNQWSALPALDQARSYWGVAFFEGTVYAAHLGGIDMVSQGTLVPISIGDASDLQFTVLRGAADGVWSFAGKTIGQMVGDQWHTVVGAQEMT